MLVLPLHLLLRTCVSAVLSSCPRPRGLSCAAGAVQRYISRLKELLELSGGEASTPAGAEICALVGMRVSSGLSTGVGPTVWIWIQSGYCELHTSRGPFRSRW